MSNPIRIIAADFSPEGYSRFTIDKKGLLALDDASLIEASHALLSAAQDVIDAHRSSAISEEMYAAMACLRSAISMATERGRA